MTGVKADKAKHYLRQTYRSFYFPPLVIFVALTILTVRSWSINKDTLTRDIQTNIRLQTDVIEKTITGRLTSYEQILTGGAGLFRASQDVTKNEWHSYISTFDISHKLPGVQSLGYIKIVSADQIPALADYMASQGVMDFQIRPQDPPRTSYTAILYLEPENLEANGVGFDLSVNSDRRQAMERARDAGTSTTTPPLKPLLSSTDPLVFSMFVPQYQAGDLPTTTEARRQAIAGYIFAGFRAQSFFEASFPDVGNNKTMQFAVTDPSSTGEKTLYESADYKKLRSNRDYQSADTDIHIYDQTWHFNYLFETASLASQQERTAPIRTIIGGVIFSFLLAEVVYLLLRGRAKQLTVQKEQDVELAKDELLSLASHQLRTPATAVKQYLGMVLQGFAGDITPTQHALLEKAFAGNERQLYTINEMLHLAKVDSGRITLSKREIDLVQLVRTIVKDQKNAIKEAKHKLVLKLPKRPVRAEVDEHMFGMAVENLINNGIKYMPQGGTLTIGLRTAQNSVRIYVKDVGIGIDVTDVPKLFKLFSRVANDLSEQVGGTGVGLYLARHLVELHGGRIEVRSHLQKGSTFTIILPKGKG